MNEFLNNLDFENVNIDLISSSSERINIDFSLREGFNYFVEAERASSAHNDWREIKVIHFTYGTCPYCQSKAYASGKYTVCSFLSKYKKEIFEHLLNHPSIRLRRLFI